MEKVSEMTTEPIVGKFYFVPCVESRYGGFLPVIPIWHEEGAYAPSIDSHYHFDVRFFTENQLSSRYNFSSKAEATMAGIARETPTILGRAIKNKEVVWRKLKCRREMPNMPRPFFFSKIEKDFIGRKALCGKCPHRGFPLESLPKDANGMVICNGHGLKIDMNRKKVVKR